MEQASKTAPNPHAHLCDLICRLVLKCPQFIRLILQLWSRPLAWWRSACVYVIDALGEFFRVVFSCSLLWWEASQRRPAETPQHGNTSCLDSLLSSGRCQVKPVLDPLPIHPKRRNTQEQKRVRFGSDAFPSEV